MKVILAFAYIFAVFAFLTMGSLMIIVSLHVLAMEDALLKVEALYENPWQSLKMGVTGIFFIFMGLVFAKILVKSARPNDDVILYGKWGHVNVSVRAIEDLVRKALRKFDVIRVTDIKIDTNGNQLGIETNLSVLAGWNLSELINTVQKELSERLCKMLGAEIELNLVVNIVNIIEQPITSEVV